MSRQIDPAAEVLRGREAVAAEVRALMGRHRVPQTRLATVLEMSQSSLSARLRGELPFNVDELLKIAAFFDVEVSRLLTPSSVCITGSEIRDSAELALAS